MPMFAGKIMNTFSELCAMLAGPAIYVAVAFAARWRWPHLRYRAWTSALLMVGVVALHALGPFVKEGSCMPTYPLWFHVTHWALLCAFVCAFASILAGILREWKRTKDLNKASANKPSHHTVDSRADASANGW